MNQQCTNISEVILWLSNMDYELHQTQHYISQLHKPKEFFLLSGFHGTLSDFCTPKWLILLLFFSKMVVIFEQWTKIGNYWHSETTSKFTIIAKKQQVKHIKLNFEVNDFNKMQSDNLYLQLWTNHVLLHCRLAFSSKRAHVFLVSWMLEGEERQSGSVM